MKGLDGLQGPIYVGTGCVFRRQALYGYDAPIKKKPPSKTCNCWPKWCCLCCGSRKNQREKLKREKLKKEKKKTLKQKEASKQIHALETVKESTEGNFFVLRKQYSHISHLIFQILSSMSNCSSAYLSLRHQK